MLPIPSMLNYLVYNFYGVSITYWLVSGLFERRRSPLLWYAYFGLRSLIDSNLYWLTEQGEASPELTTFFIVWQLVHSFLSLVVIWQSWKGDYVLLAVCAVICDPLASEINTFSTLNANYFFGQAASTSYFVPIGLHTFMGGLFDLLVFMIIRMPLASLLRFACRFVLRHRLVWGIITVGIVVLYTVVMQVTASAITIGSHIVYTAPTLAFLLAAITLPLVRQSRIVARRSKLLADCLALSRSYDATIRAELASLERDRRALEGHEVTLRRLSENGDPALAERINELRVVYKKLSAGSYCDRPALDAVLVAGAKRLQEAGVEVKLTVAGVPMDAPVPVTAVLTLFNLANEAAERNVKRQGDDIELRIRGIDGHVLLHLEVPLRWGALWAKRYLSVFSDGDEVLIRERKQGDRRVVLVLCEGVVA